MPVTRISFNAHPAGTRVSSRRRAPGSSVRAPGLTGWPAALSTVPATRAVRVLDSVTSIPTTSCDVEIDTNCASPGFGVPGEYDRPYPGMSVDWTAPAEALTT